eukprot:CAMPEP_0206156146 /NCGR_PEP_ID=MMETSP1474-20131121/2732_1 /ASSEMBLY_ACC=CAM_ASM_001110 /TAXON_ID=97495 /ORGANISM="Imantonia sp., Strain RCC918" /LENGTH=129 /DNA_ID=CAMNT_0053555095 /DNA_START=24 /DNA_END=413 /DNA_ORIENTATION=-
MTKFVQDGPPEGGYKAVNVARSLPKGGASSLALAVGSVCVFAFGMYKVVSANRLRREWKREELDIRMAILPFLQAESDVQASFFSTKLKEHEAELMKDVPNWEAGASVYKSSYQKPMSIVGVPSMPLWR